MRRRRPTVVHDVLLQSVRVSAIDLLVKPLRKFRGVHGQRHPVVAMGSGETAENLLHHAFQPHERRFVRLHVHCADATYRSFRHIEQHDAFAVADDRRRAAFRERVGEQRSAVTRLRRAVESEYGLPCRSIRYGHLLRAMQMPERQIIEPTAREQGGGDAVDPADGDAAFGFAGGGSRNEYVRHERRRKMRIAITSGGEVAGDEFQGGAHHALMRPRDAVVHTRLFQQQLQPGTRRIRIEIRQSVYGERLLPARDDNRIGERLDAASHVHVRTHQPRTRTEPDRGVMVAGCNDDLQRIPIDFETTEPVEHRVEQANRFGGRHGQVVHIARHAQHIHMLAFDQADQPLQRRALIVEQIDAFEPASDMPIGGVQHPHDGSFRPDRRIRRRPTCMSSSPTVNRTITNRYICTGFSPSSRLLRRHPACRMRRPPHHHPAPTRLTARSDPNPAVRSGPAPRRCSHSHRPPAQAFVVPVHERVHHGLPEPGQHQQRETGHGHAHHLRRGRLPDHAHGREIRFFGWLCGCGLLVRLTGYRCPGSRGLSPPHLSMTGAMRLSRFP